MQHSPFHDLGMHTNAGVLIKDIDKDKERLEEKEREREKALNELCADRERYE